MYFLAGLFVVVPLHALVVVGRDIVDAVLVVVVLVVVVQVVWKVVVDPAESGIELAGSGSWHSQVPAVGRRWLVAYAD